MSQVIHRNNLQTVNNQKLKREELLLEMSNILGCPENLEIWLKSTHPVSYRGSFSVR